MSIFDLHSHVVEDYQRYVQSFLSISDDRLREFVEKQLVDEAIFWPDALVQLNPAYKADRRCRGGRFDRSAH